MHHYVPPFNMCMQAITSISIWIYLNCNTTLVPGPNRDNLFLLILHKNWGDACIEIIFISFWGVFWEFFLSFNHFLKNENIMLYPCWDFHSTNTMMYVHTFFIFLTSILLFAAHLMQFLQTVCQSAWRASSLSILCWLFKSIVDLVDCNYYAQLYVCD